MITLHRNFATAALFHVLAVVLAFTLQVPAHAQNSAEAPELFL